MIKINDEILNKYLDGELSSAEMSEVKQQLQSSESLQLKFKALNAVNNELNNSRIPQVSSDFTRNIMRRLSSQEKAKREQKYFIFSISTIFIIASLIIVGFALSVLFNRPAVPNVTAENISNSLIDFSLLIVNFFTAKNISIFGSIMSGGIIITAYFFFDSQKNARKNFGK